MYGFPDATHSTVQFGAGVLNRTGLFTSAFPETTGTPGFPTQGLGAPGAATENQGA